VAVTEHHRAKHDFLGQLFCFRFNHHDRVRSAGDDEVQLALFHLVEGWIEHILVVDEADTGATDRTHERRAGQRERRGRRDHRNDIRIVLLVVREHGDGDLRIATPAIGEQRADRTIDQPRCQRVFFGWAAFAFEVAAGNPAGRIIFFGVIDSQRKEIDAFFRHFGRDDRG
jgi:hypothetical protein